jgi:hypothetical protein
MRASTKLGVIGASALAFAVLAALAQEKSPAAGSAAQTGVHGAVATHHTRW